MLYSRDVVSGTDIPSIPSSTKLGRAQTQCQNVFESSATPRTSPRMWSLESIKRDFGSGGPLVNFLEASASAMDLPQSSFAPHFLHILSAFAGIIVTRSFHHSCAQLGILSVFHMRSRVVHRARYLPRHTDRRGGNIYWDGPAPRSPPRPHA